jgi:hypothetical protein
VIFVSEHSQVYGRYSVYSLLCRCVDTERIAYFSCLSTIYNFVSVLHISKLIPESSSVSSKSSLVLYVFGTLRCCSTGHVFLYFTIGILLMT